MSCISCKSPALLVDSSPLSHRETQIKTLVLLKYKRPAHNRIAIYPFQFKHQVTIATMSPNLGFSDIRNYSSNKIIYFLLTGYFFASTFYTTSCLTLCNPVNCSPPGSSVHGILQARVLEWVAMPSSRGSSQP